jgi:hypothetical protein
MVDCSTFDGRSLHLSGWSVDEGREIVVVVVVVCSLLVPLTLTGLAGFQCGLLTARLGRYADATMRRW